MTEYKIAILDLNNGYANQGMRCIRQILRDWSQAHQYKIEVTEFDIRQKLEVPDLSFDIYISSGGPGSPLESEGSEWDNRYVRWIQSVTDYNLNDRYPKKYVFFICHSFQLACRFYQLGKVCERNSTSFGVFPVHMLEAAYDEPVFEGLRDPFYAVDSRDFQVIDPSDDRLAEHGATVLAIEKERPHKPEYERAVMAVRFNDYFIGTQFHPEADAGGMQMYLERDDKKETVIANHGEEKWSDMIKQLGDPDKIVFTHNHILPNFLNMAVG